MAKTRTPIPAEVAAELLHAQDRTCCVCQTSGLALQIHHIDENPANHASGNLAALCLQDHELTQLRGGFGRKLGPDEVRLARDRWIGAVKLRRERAEETRLQAMLGGPKESPLLASISCRDEDLASYLEKLPALLRAAHTLADEKWRNGNTYDQREAVAAILQVVRDAWLRLATYFPEGHFGESPEAYFQDALQARVAWHAKFMGESGTIWPLILSRRALEEAQRMVKDTVYALAGLGANAKELDGWSAAWTAAGSRSS